jgi:PAS domain S-box-containing protein
VSVLEALLIFVLVANLVRRRRVERSLAESESRFRSAADAAPVMIWMSGADKHCTYVNKPWLEYTGHTLDQELGDGWAGGIHPDDARGSLKTYSEAFDARQPFVMEYRLRRHDGEYRWISDTGRPRTDKQGEFLGFVGSCIDITASRLKTEALIESESRLRSILDTAVEAIITVNERGVIQSVNAAAHKIFGYTAEEMIGQDVGVFITPPFHKLRESQPGHFPASNPPSSSHNGREARGRRKDGIFFPVDVNVSLLVLAGRVIITGFVRDITERKEAEQAAREFGGRLLQAQEAERARLARELHDDITQRMARLAIDAGRISPRDTAADRNEALRDVRDGLAKLSEDIHTLSYRLHPSMLRDLGLAAALRAECERFSRQSAIATEVKLAALPPRIPADAALSIFRIAQEALRNVARHAGSSAAKVSLRPLEDGLQLAVVDSGVGFDPKRQRSNPSLGLASMKERVRLLGGEFEIESAPGHGTTILAWVPLKGEPS